MDKPALNETVVDEPALDQTVAEEPILALSLLKNDFTVLEEGSARSRCFFVIHVANALTH